MKSNVFLLAMLQLFAKFCKQCNFIFECHVSSPTAKQRVLLLYWFHALAVLPFAFDSLNNTKLSIKICKIVLYEVSGAGLRSKALLYHFNQFTTLYYTHQ
jgi:hypothetical protein